MSPEIELDALANWVLHLKQLRADRAQLDEQIEMAENQIKDALGDAEVGTIGGEPVIRWSHVVSNRFDQKAAKALLTDDQVAACTKPSESRRFTIVEA
jgi:predicted phage-related endonuclease